MYGYRQDHARAGKWRRFLRVVRCNGLGRTFGRNRELTVEFRDLSKSQRRAIRDLAGLAHDRELSTELSALEAAFGRWRANELDPHELNNLIHAFHQGPSRKLFVIYTDSIPVLAVASAVVRGIIDESEVPEHVRDFVARAVSVARAHIALEHDGDADDAP